MDLGTRPALHGVGLPAPQAALLQYRRVDTAPRPLPVQDQRDCLPYPPFTYWVEAGGRRSHMWRQDDVVHLEQGIGQRGRLLFKDVEPGTGDPAFPQGFDERLFVRGWTATGADKQRLRLHLAEVVF